MAGMKIQFGISSLLLSGTFFTIWMASILILSRKLESIDNYSETTAFFLFSHLLWLPLAFIAYAFGRKTITLAIVTRYAIAEAAALAIILIPRSYWYWWQ